MRDILKITLLLGAIALGGCSFAGDGLWPDTADQAAEQSSEAKDGTTPVALGTWTPALTPPEAVTLNLPPKREVTATDSFVGRKVVDLRSDLHMLIDTLSGQQDEFAGIAGTTAQLASRYETTVSRVQSRAGAAGAPTQANLAAQLDAAGNDLDAIDGTRGSLGALAARVASNMGIASYISAGATSAMGVDGSAGQDQQLLQQILEDTAQAMAESDRLLTAISTTVARNEAQVAAERGNLQAWTAALNQGGLVASRPAGVTVGGSALISIGFGRSRLEFEDALYEVVQATLDVSPSARFKLVAVEPQRGSSGQAVKQNTRRVFQSLMDMGLPSDRVIMVSETSSAITSGEVQLYTR